ncbi:PR domain zinc finger protein 15-like [Saccostrea echinata]|uniref:PR domain zinc finger protein 15-like n=1 Tax=Saccostrea echinata TaxID=191078 RepID=UPI002A8102E3|nr:PR domain zinc finger protein 15-like [Saccostrea echinata]
MDTESKIKVEPLSPGTFRTNRENGFTLPPDGVTDVDQLEFSRSYGYSNGDGGNSMTYQNVSMPVFPNMPYASSYSYMSKTREETKVEIQNHYENDETIEMNSNTNFSHKPPLVGKKSHLPKRYKCAMCAYRTRYKSDLNRHVRKHAIATFSCDICNMPFKTIGNVEFHKRKEHVHLVEEQPPKEAMKHSCKMCTYATMYSSDLTRHVRKHYIAKFHCTLCNKPFMTSGSLVHHKRSAHGVQDVEVVMGLEGVESVKQTGGEIHSDPEMNDQKQSDINGNVNNVEFEDPKEDHQGSGAGEKNFYIENNECEEDCDSEPQGGYNYEDPDLEPSEIMPIDSDSNVMSKTEDLSKIGPEGTKHTCPYCEKSFGRKLVLEYHLKNVHKIYGRNGEIGDYVEDPDDYDLALDMSIQELENSTSPDLSSKTANNSNATFRHKCPFCAYATNYKSTYDRHVRKHELACHICNVCRMPFITFGHLQRHIRDNHPDHNQQISEKEITVEKHKCAYCNFEAESLAQLRMHTNSVHNRQIMQEIQRPPTNSGSRVLSPGKTLEEKDEARECKADHVTSFSHHDAHASPAEDGVSTHAPSTGRYAKLVSDFDDFAQRPYACSLCFYRTVDVADLVRHAENHLTGCNQTPVPETARFAMETLNRSRAALAMNAGPSAPLTSTHNNKSFDATQEQMGDSIRIKSEPHVVQTRKRPQVTTGQIMSRAQQRKQFAFLKNRETPSVDRIIPTFSVHYRKDKTNVARPYLCLLCRKRFRHLTILKQHFMQTHNESVPLNKTFDCKQCSRQFSNPMALQEHYEQKH